MDLNCAANISRPAEMEILGEGLMCPRHEKDKLLKQYFVCVHRQFISLKKCNTKKKDIWDS